MEISLVVNLSKSLAQYSSTKLLVLEEKKIKSMDLHLFEKE